jgi:hypothetical protein
MHEWKMVQQQTEDNRWRFVSSRLLLCASYEYEGKFAYRYSFQGFNQTILPAGLCMLRRC